MVETVLLLPYCVYIVYFGVCVGEEEHHEMPSYYHSVMVEPENFFLYPRSSFNI